MLTMDIKSNSSFPHHATLKHVKPASSDAGFFHFISLSNRCSAQHSAAQQNRVNIQLLIQQEHIRQLARLERAVIVLNADSARRIGGRGTNRLTERKHPF